VARLALRQFQWNVGFVKQLAEWRTDTWRRGMKRRAEFPKKFTPA